MGEIEIIVDKLRLQFEGLFSVKDFYFMIDEFFEDRNYDRREIRHIERVAAEGKYIEFEWLPWKKYTDYVKSEIRIRAVLSDIKEVEIDKDGSKIKLNKGNIKIVLDGYLTTDYENRWESQPMFIFLRTLFDKYFYKPFTTGYQKNVESDVKELYNYMRKFFNLYRS